MSTHIPRQNEQVAYRVIDGLAALVSPRDSLLYWLNPTATFIWELADGQHTTEDIAKRLSSDYDVDPARALGDTEQMTAAFAEKGLFTLVSSKR